MKKNCSAALALRPRGIALAAAALVSSLPVLAQTAAPAAAAAPASAASAPRAAAAARKPDAAQPTVIEIQGTRASIQGAIARKRNASTVQDSIVAEDIDQFPDKNVGEALSRVTGVQLSREFGEGSQVSIRGVEPDLNRVEINGASVLGTNGGAGRGAELRELASELIQSIDVIKGSTADMTEGGVGGTVRITTRKPLQFKERTIAGTLSAESASLRGGVQPRGSLLLADKFLDGKLGVMANLVYDQVHTRGDFARNTSWAFLRDWDNSAEKTVVSTNSAMAAVQNYADCTSAFSNTTDRTNCQRQWFDYSPRISRYGIWERDHKRSSAELTAQYQVSPELDVYLSHQVNTQAQRLNDMNFGTDLTATTRLSSAGRLPVYAANGTVATAGACTAINGSAAVLPAGMVVENHHVTQYTVGNCLSVGGQGGQGAFSTAARDFALDIQSKYTTGGFNYKNDRWKIEGLLVDSSSDYKSESNNIVLTQNAPGLVVKLDANRLPQFVFPSGYSPDDASSYVQAQLQYRPSATANTERQAKLDFQYALDHNVLSRIWFGGQARESSSRQYNGGGYLVQNNGSLSNSEEAVDINARGANVNQTIVFDPLYTGTAQRPNDSQSFINGAYRTSYVNAATMQQLVNAVKSRSPGTFFGGYGLAGAPSSWTAPSYAAAAGSGSFDTSAFNQANLYSTIGSDGKVFPQIPAFDIRERIQAGYARLDWGTDVAGLALDGNLGLRFTRTNVQSTGLFSERLRVETAVGSTTFNDRVVRNTIVSIDNTYNDVLPSLNATLQLMKGRLFLRGGWAKVMARPALNLLAPNVTCTENSGNSQFGGDGTDDCTAGNPDLKPYRATKYDLSLEYYPSRDSQVSAAVFKTDIDTYVRTGVYRAGVDFFGDGRLFDVTQAVNGQGAQTFGLELAGRTALTFLPGWLSGFGVDANYTLMNFKYSAGNELINPLDGSVLPYPGLSRNAYNLGLWYDQGLVNARLAYHHRNKYFSGGLDVSGNPNFRDGSGYLDAKLQLRLNKQITVSFEAKNLLDQAELSYSGDLSRPNELAWSGRRYYLSVGFKL
ncbi:TonB-dependent receptor [Aquabacterium sp. OR-4]|uniref:TonB-dependent receptor n=1 Tax=Aquabacterium sp. OR-4 TaxID=2978127 RepID=UPI0028C9394C|nr:TonB-dependent receptor [Aquabacterium sp. OR-4]MDT7838903.1 TonB-dependent receptor [Aquabacterium sp. OR-4]